MKYDYRIFDSLESTNARCKEEAKAGADEGLVIQAYEQTGGYGRRGSQWDSPLGGLYISMLLKPNVAPAALAKITSVAAVACCRAAVSMGVRDVHIKAPNDIVLSAQANGTVAKLAGVIAEAAKGIVCLGIGMNVVHFGNPLADKGKYAVAYIHSEAFLEDSRMVVDAARESVLNAFADAYETWLRDGFEALQEEYDSYYLNAEETD